MRLIAITPENDIPNEQEYIYRILEAGFDYVHIRKPKYSMDDMREYLDGLDNSIHKKLKLHSCFELADEYGIGGIHLNHRNSNLPMNSVKSLKISRSCHFIAELDDCARYEYVFLSPVFDSISKAGYRAKFNLSELKTIFCTKSNLYNIVALGGVTPECLPLLCNCGFCGAAFLGYLFNSTNIIELNGALTEIKRFNV